jgi:DNA sulfur modification protein DndD
MNLLPENLRDLKEIFKVIEIQVRNIKRLEEKIQRACDNDLVLGLHNQINERNQILGAQESEANVSDKEINSLDRLLLDAKKRLDKLYHETDKSEDTNANFERIEDIQVILKEFEEALTLKKVQQLEDAILDCYSRIHRKAGFIRSVSIDPVTFDVTMFDKFNKAVPVDKLSAGEKQVYAISVLWALSKLSGKSLPMVIDTPLGRLDSTHRENLVNNFFPHASHQVVILSTDTEIDHKYFDDLNKHISHTYSIDFNLDDSHSTVNNGYFAGMGALQ